MSTAKITRCRHYFHGVCLRKWLYVQDRCPLCHEIIMHHEPTSTEKQNTPAAEAPAAAAAAAAAEAPVHEAAGAAAAADDPAAANVPQVSDVCCHTKNPRNKAH